MIERKVVTPSLDEAPLIYLVTGSMYSGKSNILIDIIESFETVKGRVACFKPKLDKRDLGVIKSRDKKETYPALLIGEGGEVPKIPKGYLDTVNAVVVDEAQFLDLGAIKWLIQLGKGYEIPVFFAGLDKDFKDEEFEAITYIRNHNPYELVKYAKCFVCGSETAIHSRRIVNNEVVLHGEQIVIGDTETYIAVCGCCDKSLKKKGRV